MGTRKNKSKIIRKNRKTRSKRQRGGGEKENKELWAAIWTGDLTKVNDALAKGANVNEKDNDGNTALILACIAGMPETNRLNIVKTLISKGAKVDVVNDDEMTALMYCQHGNIAVMRELINNIKPALKRANYVNATDTYDNNVITYVDEFFSDDPVKLKEVLRLLINAGLTGADNLINDYQYPRDVVQPLIDARDTSMAMRTGRTSSSVFNKLPHRPRTMGGRSMKRGNRKTKKTNKN
jgi:hypothetical protein